MAAHKVAQSVPETFRSGWATSDRLVRRAAIMDAVREAAAPSALFKGSSLANGLRCIRTFERVNDCEFNAFDKSHRDTVRGMGVHEELFRKLRLVSQ